MGNTSGDRRFSSSKKAKRGEARSVSKSMEEEIEGGSASCSIKTTKNNNNKMIRDTGINSSPIGRRLQETLARHLAPKKSRDRHHSKKIKTANRSSGSGPNSNVENNNKQQAANKNSEQDKEEDDLMILGTSGGGTSSSDVKTSRTGCGSAHPVAGSSSRTEIKDKSSTLKRLSPFSRLSSHFSLATKKQAWPPPMNNNNSSNRHRYYSSSSSSKEVGEDRDENNNQKGARNLQEVNREEEQENKRYHNHKNKHQNQSQNQSSSANSSPSKLFSTKMIMGQILITSGSQKIGAGRSGSYARLTGKSSSTSLNPQPMTTTTTCNNNNNLSPSNGTSKSAAAAAESLMLSRGGQQETTSNVGAGSSGKFFLGRASVAGPSGISQNQYQNQHQVSSKMMSENPIIHNHHQHKNSTSGSASDQQTTKSNQIGAANDKSTYTTRSYRCDCDDELADDDMLIPFEHPTKISHGFWLQRYSNLHNQEPDNHNQDHQATKERSPISNKQVQCDNNNNNNNNTHSPTTTNANKPSSSSTTTHHQNIISSGHDDNILSNNSQAAAGTVHQRYTATTGVGGGSSPGRLFSNQMARGAPTRNSLAYPISTTTTSPFAPVEQTSSASTAASGQSSSNKLNHHRRSTTTTTNTTGNCINKGNNDHSSPNQQQQQKDKRCSSSSSATILTNKTTPATSSMERRTGSGGRDCTGTSALTGSCETPRPYPASSILVNQSAASKRTNDQHSSSSAGQFFVRCRNLVTRHLRPGAARTTPTKILESDINAEEIVGGGGTNAADDDLDHQHRPESSDRKFNCGQNDHGGRPAKSGAPPPTTTISAFNNNNNDNDDDSTSRRSTSRIALVGSGCDHQWKKQEQERSRHHQQQHQQQHQIDDLASSSSQPCKTLSPGKSNESDGKIDTSPSKSIGRTWIATKVTKTKLKIVDDNKYNNNNNNNKIDNGESGSGSGTGAGNKVNNKHRDSTDRQQQQQQGKQQHESPARWLTRHLTAHSPLKRRKLKVEEPAVAAPELPNSKDLTMSQMFHRRNRQVSSSSPIAKDGKMKSDSRGKWSIGKPNKITDGNKEEEEDEGDEEEDADSLPDEIGRRGELAKEVAKLMLDHSSSSHQQSNEEHSSSKPMNQTGNQLNEGREGNFAQKKNHDYKFDATTTRQRKVAEDRENSSHWKNATGSAQSTVQSDKKSGETQHCSTTSGQMQSSSSSSSSLNASVIHNVEQSKREQSAPTSSSTNRPCQTEVHKKKQAAVVNSKKEEGKKHQKLVTVGDKSRSSTTQIRDLNADGEEDADSDAGTGSGSGSGRCKNSSKKTGGRSRTLNTLFGSPLFRRLVERVHNSGGGGSSSSLSTKLDRSNQDDHRRQPGTADLNRLSSSISTSKEAKHDSSSSSSSSDSVNIIIDQDEKDQDNRYRDDYSKDNINNNTKKSVAATGRDLRRKQHINVNDDDDDADADQHNVTINTTTSKSEREFNSDKRVEEAVKASQKSVQEHDQDAISKQSISFLGSKNKQLIQTSEEEVLDGNCRADYLDQSAAGERSGKEEAGSSLKISQDRIVDDSDDGCKEKAAKLVANEIQEDEVGNVIRSNDLSSLSSDRFFFGREEGESENESIRKQQEPANFNKMLNNPDGARRSSQLSVSFAEVNTEVEQEEADLTSASTSCVSKKKITTSEKQVNNYNADNDQRQAGFGGKKVNDDKYNDIDTTKKTFVGSSYRCKQDMNAKETEYSQTTPPVTGSPPMTTSNTSTTYRADEGNDYANYAQRSATLTTMAASFDELMLKQPEMLANFGAETTNDCHGDNLLLSGEQVDRGESRRIEKQRRQGMTRTTILHDNHPIDTDHDTHNPMNHSVSNVAKGQKDCNLLKSSGKCDANDDNNNNNIDNANVNELEAKSNVLDYPCYDNPPTTNHATIDGGKIAASIDLVFGKQQQASQLDDLHPYQSTFDKTRQHAELSAKENLNRLGACANYSALIRPVPSNSPSNSSIIGINVGLDDEQQSCNVKSISKHQSDNTKKVNEQHQPRVVVFQEHGVRVEARPQSSRSNQSPAATDSAQQKSVDHHKPEADKIKPENKPTKEAVQSTNTPTPSVGSQIATNFKRLIKRQQSVDSYRMARELKNKMKRQQEADSVITVQRQQHQAARGATGSGDATNAKQLTVETSAAARPNSVAGSSSQQTMRSMGKQTAGSRSRNNTGDINQVSGRGKSAASDESFLAATKRKASVCAGQIARARGTLNFVKPIWAEPLLAEQNKKQAGPNSELNGATISVRVIEGCAEDDDSGESINKSITSGGGQVPGSPKPPNTLNLNANHLSASGSTSTAAAPTTKGGFVVGSFSGSITPTYPTHHLPSIHYVAKKYSNASTISSSIAANELSSLAANSSLYLGLDSIQLDCLGGINSPSSRALPISDTDTSKATSPIPSAVMAMIGGGAAANCDNNKHPQQFFNEHHKQTIGLGSSQIEPVAKSLEQQQLETGNDHMNNSSQPATDAINNQTSSAARQELAAHGLTEDEANLIAQRAYLAEGIYENKVGLGEDMKFLASLPELCDITFLVGDTREPVCAVKSVLAARSRVFHKILFGGRMQRHQFQHAYHQQQACGGQMPFMSMSQQQYSKSSVETSLDEGNQDGGLISTFAGSKAHQSSTIGSKFLGTSRKSIGGGGGVLDKRSHLASQKQTKPSLDHHHDHGTTGNWSVTLHNNSGETSLVGRSVPIGITATGKNSKTPSGRTSVASGRESSLSSHQGSQDPLLVIGPGHVAAPMKQNSRNSKKTSFRSRPDKSNNWDSRDSGGGPNSGGPAATGNATGRMSGGRRLSRMFTKRISDSSIKHQQNKAAAYQASRDSTGYHNRRNLLHHNNSLGSSIAPGGGAGSLQNNNSQQAGQMDRSSRMQAARTTMIIEEFEPDVFRQLIEYIHTGCVLLQARTLLGLLNAADYYGLEQLRKACLRFVSCCINVDTVCSLLATAERYIQYKCTKSIVQKVLEFVDSHADEIFKLNAFGLLPEHVVRLILARDGLQADELVKYNGVYTWCEHYCRSYEETNIAEVMRGFLDMIQFHKIPRQALLADIYPTHIVPDNIFLSALAYQAEPNKFEPTQQMKARRMTLPNPVLSKHSFGSEGEESRDSSQSNSSQSSSSSSSSEASSDDDDQDDLDSDNKKHRTSMRKPINFNQQNRKSLNQRKSSRVSSGGGAPGYMLNIFQHMSNNKNRQHNIERSHSSATHHQTKAGPEYSSENPSTTSGGIPSGNSPSQHHQHHHHHHHHATSSKSASPGLWVGSKPQDQQHSVRKQQQVNQPSISHQYDYFDATNPLPAKQPTVKRKGSIAQVGINGMIKLSHKLSMKRRQSTSQNNNTSSKSRLGLLHKKAPGIYKSEVDPIDPNDPLQLGQQILNAYLLEQGQREAEMAERRAAEEAKRRSEIRCSNPIVNIASATAATAQQIGSNVLENESPSQSSNDHQQYRQQTSGASSSADGGFGGPTSNQQATSGAQQQVQKATSNRKSFKDFKHISKKIFSRNQSSKQLSSQTTFTGGPGVTAAHNVSSKEQKDQKKRSVFKIKRSETVFEATSCP